MPHVEWRLVFIIVGLAGLPVLLLLLSVREPYRMGVAVAAAPAPFSDVIRFLRSNGAAIAALFGATAMMMAVSSGLLRGAPTILIREMGDEPRRCRIQHGHERADRRGDRAIADGLRE